MTIPNEHLELMIAQRLLHSKRTSSQSIDVRASGGDVSLCGQVNSFREKLAAQDLTESCPDVTNVNNLLTVSPHKPVADSDLILQVRQQFAMLPDLGEDSILIESEQGRLRLLGYVATPRAISLARDVARSTAGVIRVLSLLMVNPDRAESNRSHAKMILEKIGQVVGLQNEQLFLSVVDETAQVSGIVDAIWKKEAVENTLRKFKILSVANEISVKLKL